METFSIGRFVSVANGLMCGIGEHPTGWCSTHPFNCGGFRSSRKTRFGATSRASTTGSYQSTVAGSDVWIGADIFVSGGVTIATARSPRDRS